MLGDPRGVVVGEAPRYGELRGESAASRGEVRGESKRGESAGDDQPLASSSHVSFKSPDLRLNNLLCRAKLRKLNIPATRLRLSFSCKSNASWASFCVSLCEGRGDSVGERGEAGTRTKGPKKWSCDISSSAIENY